MSGKYVEKMFLAKSSWPGGFYYIVRAQTREEATGYCMGAPVIEVPALPELNENKIYKIEDIQEMMSDAGYELGEEFDILKRFTDK